MSLSLFETKSPLALLGRFAWPSIISLLASALYNVVDRAFVGQLVGTDALTAVSVVFPLSMALFAVALGLGSGAATLVSLSLGKKDPEAAEEALGQTILLGIGVSAGLSLALVPLTDPLLSLMGTPARILGPAREFFWVTLLGTPFLALSMGLGLAVRSQGRAKSSMVIGLVGILSNIALCALFVGVLGWGLLGSAWATVIAQLVGGLVTLGFYFTPLSHLKLRLRHLAPRLGTIAKVSQLGLPSFAFQAIGVFLMGVLNARVQGFGAEMALASVGIINTLINFFYMPVVGLVQGAVPMFGYYTGAGKAEKNRQVFAWVLGISTGFFTVCTILVEFFPQVLLSVFTRDPALTAFSIGPLQVFLFLTPLAALQVLPPSYFQAVGKPVPALVISLVRPVLLLTLVLVLPCFWGFNGFLASGPLSDAAGVVTALWCLAAARPFRGSKTLEPTVTSTVQ